MKWTADGRGVKGSKEAKMGPRGPNKATQEHVKEIERRSKGEMSSQPFGSVLKI